MDLATQTSDEERSLRDVDEGKAEFFDYDTGHRTQDTHDRIQDTGRMDVPDG